MCLQFIRFCGSRHRVWWYESVVLRRMSQFSCVSKTKLMSFRCVIGHRPVKSVNTGGSSRYTAWLVEGRDHM